MKIYEHKLGPRLRETPRERLVLADGFSCKTQIEQATGRRPLHLAQLLQFAKHGDRPPIDTMRDSSHCASAFRKRSSALLVGAAAVAFGAFFLGRRMFR